eukprot:m.90119 g.90119  ORF g.90119 m.90119 type:complete len:265 (-) comp14871_c0_seq24:741-1535(-)
MGSGGPTPDGHWDYGSTAFASHLLAAVNASMVDEAKMDKALMRVLERRFSTGFDDPTYLDPWADLGPSTIGAQSHLDLALATARASVVILSNHDQLLPLTGFKEILVVGPNANVTNVYLGGTYSAFPTASIPSFLTSFVNLSRGTRTVTFIEGCNTTACKTKDQFTEVAKLASQVDAIIFVGGIDGDIIEHESTDRGSPDTNWTVSKFPCETEVRDPLGLPGCQGDLLALVAQSGKPVIQVIVAGGPVVDGTFSSTPSLNVDRS